MDIEHGIGVIVDENSQDIQFRLETVSANIGLNSKVTFEIELTAKGLSAMNIELQVKKVLVDAL